MRHTNSSHTMQGAFGNPTTMKGILMGCSTVDIQEFPLTFVIPDESVSDPLLSDSLVSAGRLMEAGFEVIFRLSACRYRWVSAPQVPHVRGHHSHSKPIAYHSH